jgi:hypothetical protein
VTREAAARAKAERAEAEARRTMRSEQQMSEKWRSQAKQLASETGQYRSMLEAAGLLLVVGDGDGEREQDGTIAAKEDKNEELRNLVENVIEGGGDERRRASFQTKLKKQLQAGEITFREYKQKSKAQ